MSAVEEFRRQLREASALSGGSGLPAQVAGAAAAALGLDGAALTLRTAPANLQLMAVTGVAAARVEDLQMTLGEGPTVEAYQSWGPVLVGDLTRLEPSRWPILEAALSTADVGAVSALPLQLGAIRLGVLSLYRSSPGLPAGEDLAEALDVADAATAVLLMAGQGTSVDDSVLSRLAGSEHSNQINQATGMVIAQLHVSAEEAYVRLRSYAFAAGRPLSELADAVVSRVIRLDR